MAFILKFCVWLKTADENLLCVQRQQSKPYHLSPSCTLLQMPQLYYHPQNPSFATDSAKKVRKNRIVAPKRVQMKAPFYIRLALALLILQACDIDAAQEEYAA